MKKDYLERASYPKDLTDSQLAVIEPLFVGMREYKYSKRELPKYTDFRIFRQLNRIHLSSCSFVRLVGQGGGSIGKKGRKSATGNRTILRRQRLSRYFYLILGGLAKITRYYLLPLNPCFNFHTLLNRP